MNPGGELTMFFTWAAVVLTQRKKTVDSHPFRGSQWWESLWRVSPLDISLLEIATLKAPEGDAQVPRLTQLRFLGTGQLWEIGTEDTQMSQGWRGPTFSGHPLWYCLMFSESILAVGLWDLICCVCTITEKGAHPGEEMPGWGEVHTENQRMKEHRCSQRWAHLYVTTSSSKQEISRTWYPNWTNHKTQMPTHSMWPQNVQKGLAANVA